MMGAFFHGFILAFGLILPLGVQNLFIFNQGAVQPSFFRALPSIVTASVCDTLLILLAVLGVSLVIFTFSWLKIFMISLGILFLSYMGWLTWHSRVEESGEGEGMPPGKQIAFSASVSLLNPHAILDTIGVIGTSSLSYNGQERYFFTLACILVSWLWFFGLAAAGRILKSATKSRKWLVWLNKISALIIWGTAVYLGLSLF